MKIKFIKTLDNAEVPVLASDGAAGFDLTAAAVTRNIQDGSMVCDTGIAMEIPKGYVGLVFPRGSIHKTYFRLSNSVGVVDSDFRGSVKVLFKDTIGEHTRTHLLRSNTDANGNLNYNVDVSGVYKVGDRVAQIVFMKLPKIEFVEATSLSVTKRGDGMLGSTGK